MDKGKIALGATGVEITRLTLGGNTFGWTSSPEESFEVLDAYVAAGGNSVDTADVYSAWAPGNSGGASEKILGRWLAARARTSGPGRDEVVIATKVGVHPEFRGLSPENVAAACDASLKRLGLDHVDLYFAHFDDDSQPVSAMAEAFSALVDAGKVRAVGLSNLTAERMREWADYAREHSLAAPAILQQHYNLVERKAFEGEYMPLAAQFGMVTESYYALASGFLTGKYRSAGDIAANAARGEAAQRYLTPEGLAVVDALADVAGAAGASPASVAIAWQLAKRVGSPVASARVPSQLVALFAAIDLKLDAEQVAALDAASAPFA